MSPPTIKKALYQHQAHQTQIDNVEQLMPILKGTVCVPRHRYDSEAQAAHSVFLPMSALSRVSHIKLPLRHVCTNCWGYWISWCIITLPKCFSKIKYKLEMMGTFEAILSGTYSITQILSVSIIFDIITISFLLIYIRFKVIWITV